MSSTFQKNTGFYKLLMVIVAIVIAFKITGNINDRLVSIRIQAVPQKTAKMAELNAKTLYPVVVHQNRVDVAPEDGNLDVVFRDRVEVAQQQTIQEVRPDFDSIFRQAIRLDATSPRGAFINGKFRSVGEDLVDLTLSNGSASVTPKLYRVREGEIVVTYGADGRMVIKADGRNGT